MEIVEVEGVQPGTIRLVTNQPETQICKRRCLLGGQWTQPTKPLEGNQQLGGKDKIRGAGEKSV